MARDFPRLLARYHARLTGLGDQIIDGLDEMTSPDYVEKPGDKIKSDLVKHASILLGIGTAGAKGGTPSVAQEAPQREDVSGLSPYERARRTREKIEAEREARRKARRKVLVGRLVMGWMGWEFGCGWIGERMRWVALV